MSMCGIGGKISWNSSGVNKEELAALSERIAHRGPDDEGIYLSVDKKVGLVSRRLSILDLTSAGHQPMKYLHRYWMVFNGEIYNFQEIKKSLLGHGYAFKSNSDTEVILASYDKYREKCVDHLRGMFAFAVYDQKLKVLFAARDRLGKKPFKYYYKNGVFIFASELKAILTQKEVQRIPDWTAICHYLTFGYCPAPMTGFADIQKLEPGHWLKLDVKNKQLTKKRYWNLDCSSKLELSEKDWQKLILQELETATKLRMVADVPVGAFLSGGVDSSAVVAMMAKNSSKPVKTFTIGFAGKEYDESEHARRISRLYKTDHEVLIVKPESIEILPELAASFEEPFADNSSIITYLVSKMARKYVKVVLNGDGGDENFSGYNHHLKLARDLWFAKNPRALKLGSPLGLIWPRARRFLKKQDQDIRIRYLDYKSIFKTDGISLDLWLKKCEETRSQSLADQILNADLSLYFPDDLLAKVDIASMSVGLEARSPFADHKLTELAAQIPFGLKVKNGETKYILKRALEGIVPKENLYRKKMGFTIPLSLWFTGELNNYTKKVLLGQKSVTKHFFKLEQLNEMLSGHTQKNDFGPRLWSLLMLELWWRHYFN